MIIIFQKFRTFWSVVWNSIKEGLSAVLKGPLEVTTQEWRDTSKINFLDIFVGKLNNLANTEATFDIESDSNQTEWLKTLCKGLESKRFEITAATLADGDYYVFPKTNEKGEISHSYLTQQQVRILSVDGEDYREVEGIIDWHIDKNNRTYFLLRNHKLDDSGTLTVSYKIVDENNRQTTLARWAHLDGQAYSFANANHIGFGRYKSPASSRGLSPVYGVPLNFGCGEIEKRIFNDLKLIEDEFKNAKSKIFADERIVREVDEVEGDKKSRRFKIIENLFPVRIGANQSGPSIDIFSPDIRYSAYYDKLIADMALYEKEVGTSKGILTDNETTETATATAVKRANADTLALIDKIHNALDKGNEMTLQADSVFLNVPFELWNYTSSWYDPFEDPAEQWKRLIEAKNNGAAETTDLISWVFPNLSTEEAEEKLARIKQEQQGDTNKAIDKLFEGE